MFGLFEKDSEVERIMARLAEQLEDISLWKAEGENSISHQNYNLKIDNRRIINPDHIFIPFQWCRIFKKKIKEIHRIAEIARLEFIFDNVDGKYPYYVSCYGDKQKNWLLENAEEGGQYIIIEISHGTNKRGIYFKDAELGMAYKLMWSD